MTTVLWLCLLGAVLVVAASWITVERATSLELRLRLCERTQECKDAKKLIAGHQAANAELLERLNKIKEALE